LARHGHVVAAVRRLLEVRAPRMVEPAETFVTGEGSAVCILVIPHHWLGGLSLVVWSDPREIVVLWAAVTNLDDHDAIDTGEVVARWPAGDGDSLEQLVTAIGEELGRRIEWRCTFRGDEGSPQRASAALRIEGKSVGLDVLKRFHLWGGAKRDVIEQTSFDAEEPPRCRLPVSLARLLAKA